MNMTACRLSLLPYAMPRPTNALIAVCLALLISSCAPQHPIEALCPAVPAVLLQPTPAAILPVNATWRDVALYAASQRSAVGQCNFDKAQVKQWSDSQTAMEAE